MDYNKVLLVGRVGRDPEMNYTRNRNEKTYFSLATHRFNPKAKENEKESTEWHNIVFFKDKARDVMDVVKKGMLLKVEGSLHYYNINIGDRKVQQTEIWCNSFVLVDKDFKLEPVIYQEPHSDGEEFNPALPQTTTPKTSSQIARAIEVHQGNGSALAGFDEDDIPF